MRVSILLALICAVARAKITFEDNVAWAYEDDVAVLDPSNFDTFIQAQKFTLIEFYAPWCGHCKSLAPEWAAAAGKTRKLFPATILAKVDADTHKELAERYDVSGYPTIKVFKSGKAEEYDGPRDTKGIVSFVKKATGFTGAGTLTHLKTEEDASSLLKETGGDALVGCFREPTGASKMFQAFAEVASELPSYTTNKQLKAAYSASYGADPVAAKFGVKQAPAVLLFKNGESEPTAMPIPRKRDEFTEEAIIEWLQSHLK